MSKELKFGDRVTVKRYGHRAKGIVIGKKGRRTRVAIPNKMIQTIGVSILLFYPDEVKKGWIRGREKKKLKEMS